MATNNNGAGCPQDRTVQVYNYSFLTLMRKSPKESPAQFNQCRGLVLDFFLKAANLIHLASYWCLCQSIWQCEYLMIRHLRCLQSVVDCCQFLSWFHIPFAEQFPWSCTHTSLLPRWKFGIKICDTKLFVCGISIVPHKVVRTRRVNVVSCWWLDRNNYYGMRECTNHVVVVITITIGFNVGTGVPVGKLNSESLRTFWQSSSGQVLMDYLDQRDCQ